MDENALAIASSSPAAMAHIATEGRWKPFEHLLKVDDYLLRVAANEIDRLIIELPIRHGKSELVSHYFPAWWLGSKPNDQVMVLGYGDTFARNWGRKARDTLAEIGPRIFGVNVSGSSAAADWWHIEGHVGTMLAAGIGGQITGKGADIMIIDDPVKNQEEAMSQNARDKLWEWWQATSASRLQPGGRVVLVMARWHEDDLAGRLREEERWEVLRLPALAEANDMLGRAEGEALCPEMYDKEALLDKKKEMGGFWFAALLQQAPAPAEGLLFKRADFRYWRAAIEEDGEPVVFVLGDVDGETPKYVHASTLVKFQTCDVAASDKTTSDWTVVSTWGATPERDLILLDVQRQHFETLQVSKFLDEQNDKHNRPPMWIETFGAGKIPHKELKRKGRPVRELTPEQGTQIDKTQRALEAITAVGEHRIFFPKTAPFLDAFENELTIFPGGHDDQVDTLSYAVRLLPTVASVQTVRTPVKNATTTGGIMARRF